MFSDRYTYDFRGCVEEAYRRRKEVYNLSGTSVRS
jgi:hypothetical protein